MKDITGEPVFYENNLLAYEVFESVGLHSHVQRPILKRVAEKIYLQYDHLDALTSLATLNKAKLVAILESNRELFIMQGLLSSLIIDVDRTLSNIGILEDNVIFYDFDHTFGQPSGALVLDVQCRETFILLAPSTKEIKSAIEIIKNSLLGKRYFYVNDKANDFIYLNLMDTTLLYSLHSEILSKDN